MDKTCKTCRWWKPFKENQLKPGSRDFKYDEYNPCEKVSAHFLLFQEYQNDIYTTPPIFYVAPTEDFGCVLWEAKNG